MAEEGLEVPEEGHARRGMAQWVAAFTAVLATLGAVVGFGGSHLMNEALLKKNEAVLRKAEATNEWNHYQSTSTKVHLTELAQDLAPPERKHEFDDRLRKYEAEKDELAARARALDAASNQADRDAEELDRPHARFAMAMICLQIAISIASITALTERRWLFYFALVSAAVGVAMCLAAVRYLR